MANRKLQTEIERTLKKVSEGLEIFHETLEKLDNASTTAQKEKIEVELKKEIKKLQRLRDLIKGWQAMSELKDKQMINEARRSIELEMERFKVLEKEMKIKAYSKEGLSQAAKLDPKEHEKLRVAQWINAAVDRLGTQTDALEAELEALQIQARKSKRLDNDKQERLDMIPETIERHKMHIRRLEQLLRFMGNDKYGPDEVNSIKDDVEYYIDANQEPDFIPDEQLYDQFGDLLDDSEDEDESTDEDDNDDYSPPATVTKSSSIVKSPSPPSMTTGTTVEPASPTLYRKKSGHNLSDFGTSSTPPTSATSSAGGLPQVTTITSSGSGSKMKISNSTSKSVVQLPHVSMPVVLPPAPTITTVSGGGSGNVPPPPVHKVSGPSFASAIATAPSGGISSTPLQGPPGLDSKPISKVIATSLRSGPSLTTPLSSSLPPSLPITVPGPYDELYAMIQRKNELIGRQKTSRGELIKILESSYLNCPDGSEMEKSRTFTPKQPFTVPSYYPSHPPAILENPAIFERFELDTLFFIFYYQQKTYAQYLAARELKRQSWRFHKKYLTWFQRHEEPKTITEEYEQGTYIYFDYEGNWCQRKKSEFTFEYRYLEDEETV